MVTVSLMSAHQSNRIQESLDEDVGLLAGSPFITPGTQIVGLKLDIKSGIVEEISRAVRQDRV